MVKKITIILLIVSVSYGVWAQTTNPDAKIIKTNTNMWLNYTSTHKFAPKWALFADIQLRRNSVLSNPMQILLRPGLIYFVNDNTNIGAGYGYIFTDQYGAAPARAAFPENRTWQQIQFVGKHGIVEIAHRIRVEQRWVHTPALVEGSTIDYEAGPAIYSNRVRMQIKASIPFKGKKIIDRSVYGIIADEVMVNWGKNVRLNTFDQNRFHIGFGYRIPKIGRIEAVYLNQSLFRGDAKTIEQNHTINITMLANFDIYKKKTE